MTYLELALKRQASIERLKSGQVRVVAAELRSLEDSVRALIASLDENLTDLSRTRLNQLLVQLRSDQLTVWNKAVAKFTSEMSAFGGVVAAQELLDLEETVDLKGTRLNSFKKSKGFKAALARPLATNGDLLEHWIKDITDREVQRVSNTMRQGYVNGLTNQEIQQSIIGTRSRNFNDGILSISRRNAETMVRTSMQHIASSAHQEVWKGNSDVISMYEFVATLDSRTSDICRHLDGQEFELDKGPIPPLHPRCRSRTVAILNQPFTFLSNGRTRSSAGGRISSESDFYDFLKSRPVKEQEEVLGKAKAKLFRDGGMSAERFRKLQFDKKFDPLTLREMARLEPAAFKKAGLEVYLEN